VRRRRGRNCRDSIPARVNRAAHDEIEMWGAGIRRGEAPRREGRNCSRRRAAALVPGQVAVTPFPLSFCLPFHSRSYPLLSISSRAAGGRRDLPRGIRFFPRGPQFPARHDFPASIASACCALASRGRLPRQGGRLSI